MANGQLHVAFGGSGGLGHAVVRELAGRGKSVRAVSRKGLADAPTGVESIAADAGDIPKSRMSLTKNNPLAKVTAHGGWPSCGSTGSSPPMRLTPEAS